MRAVVVGVGNGLRGDDGVGPAVVRALAGRVEGVRLVELSAGGVRVAEAVAGHERAVVVDAMVTGRHPPGEVRVLGSDELSPLRAAGCVHDAGLAEALAAWRAAGEAMPRELHVLGVEIVGAQPLAEGLSPAVARAVPRAVEAVLALLAGEGAP